MPSAQCHRIPLPSFWSRALGDRSYFHFFPSVRLAGLGSASRCAYSFLPPFLFPFFCTNGIWCHESFSSSPFSSFFSFLFFSFFSSRTLSNDGCGLAVLLTRRPHPSSFSFFRYFYVGVRFRARSSLRLSLCLSFLFLARVPTIRRLGRGSDGLASSQRAGRCASVS